MGIVELGLELVCVREANRFEMGRLYRGGAASRWRWLAFCGGRKKFGLWKCVPCAAFSSWLMLRAPMVEQKPPRSQSQLVWSIRSRVSAQTAGPVTRVQEEAGASVFQSSTQNLTQEIRV